MEEVACNLCGSERAELILEGKDLLHGIEGRFRLVRCCDCDLMYLNPRPTTGEIKKYYPRTYSPYQSLVDHPSWKQRASFRFGQWKNYRLLKRYLSNSTGRLLDVGCASGGFLAAMRRWIDWDLYGIEVDSQSVAYARDTLSLDVTEGSFTHSHFETDFFDIVTMWNVIEHLDAPQQALQNIARILKPEGVLAISTPNPTCIERHLFGPYWAGWDTPRHLYIYTPEVIQHALDRAGFEVISVSSYSGGYSVLALTIENLLRDKGAPEWLRRAASTILRSFWIRALSNPYYYLAGYLNTSSVMTVIARPKETRGTS